MIVVLGIVLFAISPFILVAYAGSVAEKYGCELDEGSIHPCMVNGFDRGKDLYTMGMMGWFGLATIPLGAAALVIYIVIVLIIWLVKVVRKKSIEPTVES